MHVLNAWLPPPVAEKTYLETQAFSEAVRLLQQDCSPSHLAASPYDSLKWISIANNFLQSRSYLEVADIELFITVILSLFLRDDENYYVQARWGSVLYKFLKKFSKKLSLTLHWRPFYDAFVRSVFSRRGSFEGIALQTTYAKSFWDIIRKCRRFFSKGSAAEIWAEFRPMMDDVSHNTSLEGVGFISLFLPTTSKEDFEFFTCEWFAECLELWNGVPYCQFWNAQWMSLVSRCIRNSDCMPNLHMEQFVSGLFSHFLRSFEVPVGKTSGVFPYQRAVTREIVRAFPSEWSVSVPKNIAKSVVYLLKPKGSAERHLSCMVDLLEQYYHPSNGGQWTSSLEKFLRHTVAFFLKRLAEEKRQQFVNSEACSDHAHFLTREEIKEFVAIIVKLIERGQYSKSSSLAYTAAKASSALAYIEPALVLPLSIKCFHTALRSITATHQLEAAIKTLALSARTLVIGSAMNIELPGAYLSDEIVADCKSILELAMFDTLSGLDANDPPKTMATLQFLCSMFSSLRMISSHTDDLSSVLVIDWSQWLDEFFGRLFSLLLHLESDNHLIEAVESDKGLVWKSFLVQEDSFYFSTLQLLFSRLTTDLYKQALKSVAKFVNNHTLKGGVIEIGLLCSAAVYANPRNGISELVRPIMISVLSSLEECPSTGFSGVSNSQAVFDLKTTLSPALETSIVSSLTLISFGLMFAGEHVIEFKDLVKRIIAASFDAPSAKVNEAGSRLLSMILQSLVRYFPVDQYRMLKAYADMEGVEEWLSTKADSGVDRECPTWHVPSQSEIALANGLLDMHLKSALTELKSICLSSDQDNSGILAKEKEHLRVVLLRIDASSRGVRLCLPDFRSSQAATNTGEIEPFFISGATGVSVGTADLREEAAEILHLACNYCLRTWTDDIVILSLLADSIAAVGDPGSLNYFEWTTTKNLTKMELKTLLEPPTNFLTRQFVKGHRRPEWLIIELAVLHNTWRASQAEYNRYRAAQNGDQNPPKHVMLLIEDLTSLSLHNYDAVRKMAASSLKKIFKRFPSAMIKQLPVLLKSLKDPLVPEHAALGSCAVLASRTIARYLTEDFGSFSSFFLAILSSGHHGSIKAQNAINELFVGFVLRFGGLPIHNYQDNAVVASSDNYASIVKKIQSFCASSDFTHWRYILMAQGMLILLSAHGPNSSCCQSSYDANTQNDIIGHFLLNLKSDFPPLRQLSIISLLFLLQPFCNKRESNTDFENDSMSEESTISSLNPRLVSILSQGDFGNTTFRNISVDHDFSDGETRLRQVTMAGVVSMFNESTFSTLWVPGYVRLWPRTRTVDTVMNGDGFSSKCAKLFKRLVQICGLETLEAYRGPLQEAVNHLDERGMQCSAAEVIAGFLHSDTHSILKAWDEWLQPLFKKLLLYSSVETITEWAACIRFAATGKGQLGRRSPLTRPLVLSSLLEPLPFTSSSNAVVKYFTFASAALSEIPPSRENSDELAYNQQLLSEALRFIRHPAPQVREVVGLAICLAGGNLEAHSVSGYKRELKVVDLEAVDVTKWKAFITSQTLVNAVKCQRVPMQANEGIEPMGTVLAAANGGNIIQKGDDLQNAIRFTETVLYFLVSIMKSGRSQAFMDVVVELLQPVLSLQETSHKDLSSLAKVAAQFLKFQVFPATHVSKSVSALIGAANDSNWHTRIASLSFLQSFVYRHTFLLSMESLTNIWNEVKKLLSDPQVEVKELASMTLIGMIKGFDEQLFKGFYEEQIKTAREYLKSKRGRRLVNSGTATDVHALVLGLSACVQSVPYDMPGWLPEVVTTLAQFSNENSAAVRETVRKCLSEFRRTHADTWAIQKSMFNEEQLEILTDTSSSASYFA
ncbi:hypothetical protein GOP47_0025293 [Adiantum capillus-veneris]|uniref:Proteasome activator subunit 4 n=1 Tax=Adiantum capillus-veneris TaxID=13818 RepID=A0A9D4Z2W0_ADICA|nr:hypothetical protein GOP47_0025293 [Adiantum capillus-veneris]